MSTSINIEIMRQIYERMYLPVIHNVFGDKGTAALREVLGFLPRLYANHPAESWGSGLIVFRRIIESDAAKGITGEPFIEQSWERIGPTNQAINVLELMDSGAVKIWRKPEVDLSLLSAEAVLYRLDSQREDFIIGGTSHGVLNPAPGHISVFARPTFSSLADALRDYADLVVRPTACSTLEEVWEDRKKRLFLSHKPEKHIRRSLHRFLQWRLRNVDVLPEQNVDESHPVDLKIGWTLTRTEALLEIKWVGKSRSKSGGVVEYWDARAREGARQLAVYLEQYRATNSDSDTRGFLVVIDARRRGLADDAQAISREQAYYYEKVELEFDPRYEEIRSDFEPPIRMFAEPYFGGESAA
jgi:hypothetical protein